MSQCRMRRSGIDADNGTPRNQGSGATLGRLGVTLEKGQYLLRDLVARGGGTRPTRSASRARHHQASSPTGPKVSTSRWRLASVIPARRSWSEKRGPETGLTTSSFWPRSKSTSLSWRKPSSSAKGRGTLIARRFPHFRTLVRIAKSPYPYRPRRYNVVGVEWARSQVTPNPAKVNGGDQNMEAPVARVLREGRSA